MAAYGGFQKDGSAAFLSVKKDRLVFFYFFIVCGVFLMYCVSAFMLFRRFSILYCFVVRPLGALPPLCGRSMYVCVLTA
jgi:hypothetical protein